MAYFIEFDERLVLEYVAGIPQLSDAARANVLDGVQDELGENADEYLHNDPIGGEGWWFRYEHRYHDLASGVVYRFRFVCDGTYRTRGVVRVRFVDYTTEMT